jgi:hypothetical protein
MTVEIGGGMLSRSVSMPTSLRSEGMAPTNSNVIVHKPPGFEGPVAVPTGR